MYVSPGMGLSAWGMGFGRESGIAAGSLVTAAAYLVGRLLT